VRLVASPKAAPPTDAPDEVAARRLRIIDP
jgi:hypothetical protein